MSSAHKADVDLVLLTEPQMSFKGTLQLTQPWVPWGLSLPVNMQWSSYSTTWSSVSPGALTPTPQFSFTTGTPNSITISSQLTTTTSKRDIPLTQATWRPVELPCEPQGTARRLKNGHVWAKDKGFVAHL